MQITFSPQFRPPVVYSRAGDVLTIDGEDFDFSDVLDGDTLPAEAVSSDMVVGDVSRIAGVLHLTLILPHGINAPETTRFPEPITLEGDGLVTLPVYNIEPEPEPEPEPETDQVRLTITQTVRIRPVDLAKEAPE